MATIFPQGPNPSCSMLASSENPRYGHRCAKTFKQIRKIARKHEKEIAKANKQQHKQLSGMQTVESLTGSCLSATSSHSKCGYSRKRSGGRFPSSLPSNCSSASDLSDVDKKGKYNSKNRATYHTLNDLRGIDTIQEQILERIVWPFSSPGKASLLNLKAPRGLLLIGKPGTGKTVLADAIVHEIRSNGIKVKYYQETGSCLSKYVGESEQRLRDLFRLAKDTAPSVIFFDEVDGLGGRRRSGANSSSAANTVLNTLLSEINTLPRGRVLLIAATNCPQHCDPALIRKGRFDITINIPLPSQQAREEILQHYFDKYDIEWSSQMDLNLIKEETEGFTGSDLQYLTETVHFNLIRRAFPHGSYRNMTRKEIRAKKNELGNNVEYKRDVKEVIKDMRETNQGIEEWQDVDEE